MSIPLPTLDDRTYADLLEEARALIPGFDPEWTNHNPSDPGITLIELFAWLTEMLSYRSDRLPAEYILAFLKLLNGSKWEPGLDLEEDVRATVLELRRCYRAVTAADYELLAREASPGVARARCIPRRNLAGRAEAGWLFPQEGTVSVIVVPGPETSDDVDPDSRPGAPLPSQDLLSTVREHLAPRRLLGVRQFVVPPIYVPIQAEIVVAARPDVQAEPLRSRIAAALNGYLDALEGGPEGDGWPFGRDVHLSELYRLIEEVPGVDYVPDIALSSTLENAPRCTAGAEIWNEKGEAVGIELSAHCLPWSRIDPGRLVIGSAFVAVRVGIKGTPAHLSGPAAAAARRAARSAVRRRFHPLHGGPDGESLREITRSEILDELTGLPELGAVEVVLETGPGWLPRAVEAVRFQPGELADLTVEIGF